MNKGTKETVKIFIITISSVFAVIILGIGIVIGMLCIGPIPHRTAEQVLPATSEYGNSCMNLVSSKGGGVCQWEDKILITTRSGIMILSSDFKEHEKVVDIRGVYLNVVDDKLYYNCNKGIFEHDLNTNEEKKIFSSTLYSFDAVHVVGDKAFYLKRRDISFIGCVDLESGKVSKLNTKHVVLRMAGYRENIFYYIDGNKIYAYNMLEKTEKEISLDLGIRVSTIFLKDDELFIVYDIQTNAFYDEYWLKIYNLETEEQRDFELISNKSGVIDDVVTLNNKIVYEDRKSMYIYDMESEKLKEIAGEGDCIDVFVVNQKIVARFKDDNAVWYSIYDDEGNELSDRIYH